MLLDFLVSNVLENVRIEYDIFLSDKNIEKIFNKNVFVFVETWNHDNTNVTIKVYKPVHIIKN